MPPGRLHRSTRVAVASIVACTLAPIAVTVGQVCPGLGGPAPPDTGDGSGTGPTLETRQIGIWTTTAELASRPLTGTAWEALVGRACTSSPTPNVRNLNDASDVEVMAKALVHARTGDASMRLEVIDACMAAIGTESGALALAVSRNVIGYVIAADLVGLPASEDALFRAWLEQVRVTDFQGRTLTSTHEQRANNWGTHAGAARVAIALYLGDEEELDAAATVFRGWLGDREAYAGFDFGETSWQADPLNPVGINPVGATIQGHNVDGVLPDDQRRGGTFRWPPPKVNYVYEALQGALAQAVMLERQGYDAWSWEDQALLRAHRWLHGVAAFPSTGDDTWQPHVMNDAYGTHFPAPSPSMPGKSVGWTDWTHATCNADLDGDDVVGNADLLLLLALWGTDPGSPPDFDRNGVVENGDLLSMLVRWGACAPH